MSDSYSYAGVQDDSTNKTDIGTAQFVAQQEIAQMGGPTLGKVVRAPYDSEGNPIAPGTAGPVGYIDVQPLVNMVDGNGTGVPHGTVYRLSYHRYQSGNGAIISDPVLGDIGKIVVAHRDTSAVRATGAQSNPGSLRRFDLADGTYFGCTQAGAPSQWFAFLAKGFNLTDGFGNTVIGTAEGVLINGCLINQAGDVITKSGTNLDTHVHTGVEPGGGDTGPPAA